MTIRLFKVATKLKLVILQVLVDCQITFERVNHQIIVICAESQGSKQELEWLCSVTYFSGQKEPQSESDSQICQIENPGEAF